ncbi:MAG: threonine dehydratase [Alphaproteobacteria bacterium]|nr:threonine dehydratase [Alphaproteobacteria bacterium]
MFSLSDLEHAATIVYAAMPPTPQYQWPLLADALGCEVWVKHETHTPTGAFKVRGGLVCVDQTIRERPSVTSLVSATRGNHGQSLAFAGRRVGLKVSIVVPHGNSLEKNAAMRAFGADLIEVGRDFDEAARHARAMAAEIGGEFVPSFQRSLVTGVATYAQELLTAVPDLDAIYVPIGLGSGICGVIRTRDLLGRKTQVIGVVSTEADAYAQSVDAGRVITTDTAATFADGMAVRVPNEEALEIIRAGVERVVRVSDDEIAAAIRLLWSATHCAAEGAGAASLAALMQERDRMAGRRVAVVLCGQNIDTDRFATVLAGHTPAP